MNFVRAKNHKRAITKIQAKSVPETKMNFTRILITTSQKAKITKHFLLPHEGISLEILEAKNRGKIIKCTKMNKKWFLLLILKISASKKNSN